MPYRLEICPNNRAGCKAPDCKKEGVKITKGELRHGVWVTFQEHGSWHWRHWGCVTPKVIGNMKEDSGLDTNLIDGYDELSEDLQEKALRALEQGHVDNDDWKGDVECNVPGSSGKHLTAAQRKNLEKEAAAAEADGEDKEKPKLKKRSRANKEEAAGDEEEAPVPKKARGRPKKTEMVEESDDEPAPAPKKAARGKKTKAAELDPLSETESEEISAPAKKKAAAKPKKAAAPKKATAPKKAAAPKKATKAKKAAPSTDSEEESELSEPESEPDFSDVPSEPEEKPAPKPRRGGGRKKA